VIEFYIKEKRYGIPIWEPIPDETDASKYRGEYFFEDTPVLAYDAFVEALDFKAIGIDINSEKVGNSE
jgi:hypothetical protein